MICKGSNKVSCLKYREPMSFSKLKENGDLFKRYNRKTVLTYKPNEQCFIKCK